MLLKFVGEMAIMKPHIKLSTFHLADRHPEWRYRCESFTRQGFLHIAFGPTRREAYLKWLATPPYEPDFPKRTKHG